MFFKTTSTFLLHYIILPRSKDKDTARREFILNILLVSIIILTFVAFGQNLFFYFTSTPYHGLLPVFTFAFFSFFCILLILSRLKKSKIAATIFIAFLFLTTFYTSARWGADVPQVLLLYALIIVMSGILIDTKSIFTATALTGVTFITISYLQINHIYRPDLYWKKQAYNLADTIVRYITLLIIALISWLFNIEGEKALKRARVSEAALKKQRDLLEVTVEKRTQELKQLQAEKIAQLYRFVEFGRLASGLFHDLANPLNLVSLNLNQLSSQAEEISGNQLDERKVLLHRATIGLKKLEDFVKTARKQMQSHELRKRFSVTDEIQDVIDMFHYKAKEENIQIHLDKTSSITLYGNQLKFNQVITNLISNAIDSYEHLKRKKEKKIEITAQKLKYTIQLTVQDYGEGIEKKYLDKIFEPFFTTKSFDSNTGIGLSICKYIIDKEFNGTINVETGKENGTLFTILIPLRKGK